MIIDASVALKWLVAEENSGTARALQERVDLLAPALLHVEVANGLRKKMLRGELTDPDTVLLLMESLGSLVLTVDDTDLVPRALSLALSLNHAVYDCVYLALAEQLDQELVTADQKFLRKVEATDLANLVRAL